MKCNKKFDPWVVRNEEKIRDPIEIGSTLEASKDNLKAIIGWKTESLEMKAVLDKGNAAAKLMSSHENADEVKYLQKIYFYRELLGLPRVREALGNGPRKDIRGDPTDRVLHQAVGGASRDGREDPRRNHRPPHHYGAPPAGEALHGHEDTYV